LQHVFTGRYPPQRNAEVIALAVDGKNANDNVRPHPGQKYSAELAVRSPSSSGVRMACVWKLLEESTDKTIGGANERVPNEMPLTFELAGGSRVSFAARNSALLFTFPLAGRSRRQPTEGEAGCRTGWSKREALRERGERRRGC
jgi:hypothetical protein